MPLDLIELLTWQTAAILGVLMIAGGTAGATIWASRRNRQTGQMREILQSSGIPLSSTLFSAGARTTSLVVDGDAAVVLDFDHLRIVRAYRRDEICGLKVYDAHQDRVEFRLVLAGGAESRLIVSRDPTEAIPLFKWIQQASKPVMYVG